ncbi:MAG: dihydrofolate reductase family protein [Candidatus Promineifilaceae bacterium]
MRRIVVSAFLTLDGVMQAPGGAQEDTEGGFQHGGWHLPYFDDDASQIMDERMPGLEALLLGRKTYDIFAGYWPFQPDDDPTANQLNSTRKYVVSTTLAKADWNNSTLIKANVPEEIARLKQTGSGDIWVFGSSELAQALMEHDLVDEYLLWIHPLALGDGKRLFKDSGPKTSLKLVDTKTTGSGVLVLTYRPERQE